MSFSPILPLKIITCAASCLLGVVCGGVAQADVLEIGNNGAVWVAGGPSTADSSAFRSAAEASLPVSAIRLPAVTSLTASAGPAFWRGHVAMLAAKYDISPDLLEAVVWQESRWNIHAVSSAGARGLAQLMPGTSRALGVDANDPYANLEGGARYLRAMLDRFNGDIEKALAAYNAGPRRVEQAGGIPAIRETRTYVASIMARLAQPIRR